MSRKDKRKLARKRQHAVEFRERLAHVESEAKYRLSHPRFLESDPSMYRKKSVRTARS